MSEEFKEVRGEYYWTLYIDKVTLEDEGELKVIARNPAGEISATSRLTIQGEDFIND